MATHIFLARTEEQQQFRRSLFALTSKRGQKQPPVLEPSLLLLYGSGGMGKTTLVRRLQSIAEQEPSFRGRFNTLFLDWEDEQRLTRDLQVGHDHITPETVLKVFYTALVKAGWGNYFTDYAKLVKRIQGIETKVNGALFGQQGDPLTNQVLKLGAKGLAVLIRRFPGVELVSQESLTTGLETGLQIGAEGLYQARQFVQRTLKPEEYDLYEQPQVRLAEALGVGLGKLSRRKPLVLIFDTYEVVDHPNCDYTLRRVIQAVFKQAGERTLWVIAGRSNLADSRRWRQGYFHGYQRDFSDNRLYAKSLTEFSLDLIQQYFSQAAPQRLLNETDAEAIAQFSLGIPFVIRQTAVMWHEDTPLAEIVAPVVPTVLGGEHSAYDQVVQTTSERFLVHCFGAPEREADLEAIYALALLRRPDADLLRQMLEEDDLEARLQQLKERYAFIFKGDLHLEDKLAYFLRVYLLNPLRRTSKRLQTLNERALAWLYSQLKHHCQGIADTAEQIARNPIAQTRLDLAHHCFWHSEDLGWRTLVPWLLEGWQYDRTWTQNLLEVADTFKSTWDLESVNRLGRWSGVLTPLPNWDTVGSVLADLAKLSRQGWLEGDQKPEWETISLLQQGNLAYHQDHYDEALTLYLQAERRLPTTCDHLRKDLADRFYQVSCGLIWPKNARSGVYSKQGETAAQKAVLLDPLKGTHHYNWAVVLDDLSRKEDALQSIQEAIRLNSKDHHSYHVLGNICRGLERSKDAISAYKSSIRFAPYYAHPHNGLGNVYRDLKRYGEAINAYQESIRLDPANGYPHNGLGNVYRDLKRYDEAINAYQESIRLDPANGYPHNGLGNVYRDLKRYDEAINAYQESIRINPNFAYGHNGLGLTYHDLKRYDEAIAAYRKALETPEIQGSPASAHTLVYRNLGDLYHDLKQYDEAIASYLESIQLGPTYTYAYNGLGNIYRNLKRYEDAISAYQQAIRLDPNFASPHHSLAHVYQTQRRYWDAIGSFQEASRLDPLTAGHHKCLANVYRDLKCYEDAITTCEVAIQLTPTDATFHNDLGNMYRDLKRYDDAISAYEESIQLDPTYAYAHNNLGLAHHDLKHYDEAISAYQQALELPEIEGTPASAHTLAYRNLGDLYHDLKQYDDAISAYQESIQLDPTYAYAHNGLGNVYRDLKRYDEAIAAYQESIKLEPNTYTHNGLGNVYRDLKRYDDAINAYQESIRIDPTFASPHNGLGNVYRDLKRYEDAIAAYQEAIRLDPNFAYGHNGLGLAHRDLKHYDEAISAYQQALESPEIQGAPASAHTLAYRNLGDLYHDLKRYDDAISAYQESIRIDPTYAYAHNVLGNVYRDLKRYDDAISAYQESIRLDPTNATPHNGLGAVYSDLKRFDDAIAAFQACIRIDPNYAYPHHGLGAVYSDLKRFDDAIAAFQACIRIDPNYAYPHHGLGNVYSDLKHFDDAIAAFQSALALPDSQGTPASAHTLANNGLGIVYRDLKRFDDAIAAYGQAITLKPDLGSAYAARSQTHLLNQNLEAATLDIDKALDLEPENPEFLTLKASLKLQRGGDLSEFAQVFSDLSQSPEWVQNRLEAVQTPLSEVNKQLQEQQLQNLASSLGVDVEELQAGLAQFQQMIQADPERAAQTMHFQALLMQGYACEDQGLNEDAIQAYEQAIQLGIQEATPYQQLGRLYASQGRYEDAIAAYQACIRLAPTDAYAHLSLGLTYALQAQMAEAQSLWQTGLPLLGDDVWDKLHHALYTLVLGQPEAGLAQLETLIQADALPSAIQAVLNDAEALAQCPEPPAGIETVVALLREALGNS